MAVGQGYSKTATNGLVFAYDTGDTRNSFLGRPTTNLMEGYGLSNYNNVGGSVTTTLSQTSDTYRGAPVWIQTLTPLDGSGVSWLSNGNNPGLGVVTSGGGGTANRYTGFSIFFKPTVPMHSPPIFNSYSNIGGWQSCCNYEDMGDGWYRARVLWYNTVTQSDGKYWAINPLSATLNTPITVYWAGPFKEDLNSQYISQYTPTSRSNTESLLELAGGNSMSVVDVSFNSDLQITFDGTNDYITLPTNVIPTNQITIEFICTNTNLGASNSIIAGGASQNQDLSIHLPWSDGTISWDCGRPFNRISKATTLAERSGVHHWVFTKNPSTGVMNIYLDGNLWHTSAGLTSTMPSLSSVSLGRYDNGGFTSHYFPGTIPITKIYNRELSAGEIKQNYGHYKTRFNLT
jgi:hypothetical protein